MLQFCRKGDNMKNYETSVFYFITDNNIIISDKDMDAFDNSLDSVMRSLINNGIHVKNFQEKVDGYLH